MSLTADISETEKYAHVTFFFNGGLETQWGLEERRMVPSPRVATYDLQPVMNAAGVAQAVSVGCAPPPPRVCFTSVPTLVNLCIADGGNY